MDQLRKAAQHKAAPWAGGGLLLFLLGGGGAGWKAVERYVELRTTITMNQRRSVAAEDDLAALADSLRELRHALTRLQIRAEGGHP